MQNAMKAVKSICRAAELYNVPQSTLYDRVSGKVMHGARSGPHWAVPFSGGGGRVRSSHLKSLRLGMLIQEKKSLLLYSKI